ncbi:MAG: mycofactocin biosynthesis chaperone MftB [Desulfobacteraceae bacterium 4572_88]|nr:MAG: mycofactocin biosynthesis chaperone MftB [Desulfobacteraceae bacterium 4572_88]
MKTETVYTLAEGVQVRPEVFGLLFYDYRGPRLYFVPTRNFISSKFFNGRQSMEKLIKTVASEHSWPRQQVRDRLGQVFKMLKQKGLIYEQSIC